MWLILFSCHRFEWTMVSLVINLILKYRFLFLFVIVMSIIAV
jgi:hypothetical protein